MTPQKYKETIPAPDSVTLNASAFTALNLMLIALLLYNFLIWTLFIFSILMSISQYYKG